jgi:hypothetical protein
MAKQSKTPVSRRAVIQRIQRKLAHEGKMLIATRSGRWRDELGDYHVVNVHRSAVVAQHVDPEALARELGAIKEWEKMID